jgi:hypothetical protein
LAATKINTGNAVAIVAVTCRAVRPVKPETVFYVGLRELTDVLLRSRPGSGHKHQNGAHDKAFREDFVE